MLDKNVLFGAMILMELPGKIPPHCFYTAPCPVRAGNEPAENGMATFRNGWLSDQFIVYYSKFQCFSWPSLLLKLLF